MKNKRQKAIVDIILNHDIFTQGELMDRLREMGFETTQATVSRDIKQLRLVKSQSDKGGLKYVLPPKTDDGSDFDLSAVLVAAITKVCRSGNLIVIKTHPGLANAVAAGVDGQDLSTVLGCVAGDDTIIVVTANERAGEAIAMKLCKLMTAGYDE